MPRLHQLFYRFLPFSRVAAAFTLAVPIFAIAAAAQTAPCPVVAAGDRTAAEAAYAAAQYGQAEDQYGQALERQPHDLLLSAGLVKTWLRESQVVQASALVDKMLVEHPSSAVTLTALAEVQLAKGQPWLALDTLKTAEAADPCYARVYLIRSRALRLDSMYASQRAEIQKAYDIDPSDPDIRHAWLSTVSPAHEVESISESLDTMKEVDAETRRLAEQSMRSMMPLLSENNQTCQVLPTALSASFTLQPVYQDAKHIDGYRLGVDLPKTKANLQVDTGASGLFISRELAVANGLEQAAGDPPGTVRAASLHIGPLEFRDCIVGVSNTQFAGKGDGFIGTDMFASYLVTLDYPGGKLTLSALPKQAGVVPGDRTVPPELRNFMPVYHRQQYLLVPVMLNNKSRRLFILDSGIRWSAMTSAVAHSVSETKMNFTNPVQTVSGSTLNVYRDSFDFQLANLSLNHQSHILELDASQISQNAGMQIAGMLGFDMLHSFVLQLDYRDGLVKMDSVEAENVGSHSKGTLTAAGAAALETECEAGFNHDRPRNSVLEAKVTGLIDSAHLKTGKEVTAKIVNEWQFPGCDLPAGAVLYGHVTTASASELGLVFDHGECGGLGKKPVFLTLLGVVAASDQFVGLHTALPSEVAGGGRNLGSTVQSMGYFAEDLDLNPGGPPKTIHPGVVAGIPSLKLDPWGGPSCSAKLTNADHSVRLGAGSELLLSMQPVK